MAKILTARDLAKITSKILTSDDIIGDGLTFSHFMEDLAQLITEYCGGDVSSVLHGPDDGLGWTVGIHINSSVPDDGGVYAEFDTDVTWKDGVET